MSLGRFCDVFFGIVGAALLAVVLYIALGDLSRHKGRIEALVTQSIGRPFAIDGPFKVKVIPVVDVSAESVRLGNAQGGSQPQMLEVGKAAVQIGLWSLISGPPDVRSFELSDTTVLLERASDGKGNWIITPEADDETDAEDETDADTGAGGVPVVIRSAQLNNVRLVYREANKPDRVVQLDKLSITSGREELLALDGQGKVDAYPLALKGEVGPLKSLLSARDIRMAMQGSLGKLALDIKGVIGRLDPLDGADLTLKVEHPELGGMLEKLDLPVIATGPMQINTQLKDAGALTQLDFNAKVGDLEASANGTLKTLSLVCPT
jgi:AsmA family protein